MIQVQLSQKYSTIVNTLLFLFPISLLGVKSLGDLVLALLMLMGIYIAYTDKINPFKQPELKLVSWLSVAYYTVIILSISLSGKGLELLHYADRDLAFLFTPLIALAIYKADIDFNRLILAIKLSLIMIGGYILYQHLVNGVITDWRLSLGITPTLTLIMLVFSWINISHENKYNLLLTAISSILALSLIILAERRSTFLVLIILSVLFIFLNSKSTIGKNRNNIFAIVLTLICASLLLAQPNLINRLSMAVENVKEWTTGDKVTYSSTETRLEMYKGGLLAAKEKPIFGHGYRNTTGPASRFIHNQNLARTMSTHSHLHNTFINTLVFGGIISLIVVLALLLLPLKKFWHAFKLKENSNIKYASLGILLMSGYTILSATNGMLGGVAENAFLVFFLSIFLPKVIKK
jgi:O-antigen ligase